MSDEPWATLPVDEREQLSKAFWAEFSAHPNHGREYFCEVGWKVGRESMRAELVSERERLRKLIQVLKWYVDGRAPIGSDPHGLAKKLIAEYEGAGRD